MHNRIQFWIRFSCNTFYQRPNKLCRTAYVVSAHASRLEAGIQILGWPNLT